MKGRGGDADGVSYFTARDGLGSGPKDGSNSFRRRIGNVLRSSALSSACSLTARNVSDAVQEPVFLSSRRLSGGEFRRLERASSLPSSTASTTTTAADPGRGLLVPRHRRSDSTGSAPGGEVSLDLCRPLRKERRPSSLDGGRRRPAPPRLPALLMMPPVSRCLKQAGGMSRNGKQPPSATTEASGNGSRNESTNKGPEVQRAASKTKKKGKEKSGPSSGVHLSSNPYGFTSSSATESDGDGGNRDALFSSDEEVQEEVGGAGVGLLRCRREDETETLFPSSESYYDRPCRSNSSSQRRRRKLQQLVGVGGNVRRIGNTTNDGFRPVVSLSSSTTTSMATAPVTTVCSSSTTTTTSGTHGSGCSAVSSSSPSPVSEKKADPMDQTEKKKQGMAQASPQHRDSVGLSLLDAEEEEEDGGSTAKGEQREEWDDDEDGYAVVKESSDPYSDFRSSALEMIMERQMLGTGDLERLLGAFLSLNHPSHHPVILHVFSEIWQALFDNS